MSASRVDPWRRSNTPAICRKSYVHGTVVAAFENGVLERFAQTLKGCRSPTRRAQVLAQIIAAFPQLHLLIYGSLLILIVLFEPAGIVGLASTSFHAALRRRQSEQTST